jgi:hypothetical protein
MLIGRNKIRIQNFDRSSFEEETADAGFLLQMLLSNGKD